MEAPPQRGLQIVRTLPDRLLRGFWDENRTAGMSLSSELWE